MQRRERPTFRSLGGFRILTIWYASVAIGWPSVVFLLGHSQSEGWQLLRSHWGLIIFFVGFPLAVSLIGWAMELVQRACDKKWPPAAA